MRFLIIGLGSMGKRRIRNLRYIGYTDISGFDVRQDRMDEARKLYGIDTLESLREANISEYTHIIVATPPDLHVRYAREFHALGKHVFIEASVTDEGYEELLAEISERKNILAPSCTMRFDPINVRARKWIVDGEIGKLLYCQHHFGLYLPKWHPYESIHDFYVSKRETGGAREIVAFDFVYLAWFFGLPSNIRAMVARTGQLDVEIDDIYALVYEAPACKVVQMTVDVLSQVPYRTTRIVGECGNIEIDTVAGTLALYRAASDTWIKTTRTKLSETTSTEEMYVKELECFIAATLGLNHYPYTLAEDHAILKQLYCCESFARTEA